MKIRPIEISDYEQIRRIGQQCIDLHKLNRPDDFTDTEFMNESDFQKFIPSENKYCYLIEDTEIMGFILTEYYPDLKRIYIGDLVIDEKYKRGGYGSKLYEFIIDLVHGLGATELTTTIYGFNDTCFRFADSTSAVLKKAELTYSI